MDDEVFTVIPPRTGEPRDSDPLPLAGQETSPLFEFFVPDEGGDFFIRVIALFRDEEPLGGEAPTFQIRAGRGVLTSIGPDSEEVSIPGGDGNPVGSLRCQREPNDIFLITIADIVENSGDWKLRIRNNDPESLRFFGFSAPRERDTRQPWMRLGDPETEFISTHLEFFGSDTQAIEVRNWGTESLTFDEAAGPIGDPDFGLRLESLPTSPLDPHQVGLITFETAQVARSATLTHKLSCNDMIERHSTLSLEVRPPAPPPPPPPPPPEKLPCREGCGCPDFLGPQTSPSARCQRGICEHGLASHLPI
jgi:hypothetical protein